MCIFGTDTGYILIVSGSLPEIELLSLIVIECIHKQFPAMQTTELNIK